MEFCVRRGNREVIYVDDEPSISNHISKEVIHKSLECGRRVTETKEHDSWFKESFVSNEGRFSSMSILDMNIVIPSMNVEFGEVMSVFQLVY